MLKFCGAGLNVHCTEDYLIFTLFSSKDDDKYRKSKGKINFCLCGYFFLKTGLALFSRHYYYLSAPAGEIGLF